MKIKILVLLLLVIGNTVCFAAEEKRILLTGASFAISENGWFEIGCEVFGFTPVNKSVSGSAIMQAAQAMKNGTLYTIEGLETIEAFVIMHVHNRNVASEEWLKEDYNEYTLSDATSYNIAYDYVIRKYIDDCKSLEYNPDSKYFEVKGGKPANILLCTHWHDSRTVYNPAIRKLAEKWDLPLIEWDTNIGFTKDEPDADGKQPSLKYAGDTETIDGVVYGWHPLRGKGQYIQKKMAEIYVAKLAEVLDVNIPLSLIVKSKEIAIFEGEEAHVRFMFTGLSPWTVSYEQNEVVMQVTEITDNPYIMNIAYETPDSIKITPLTVSNSQNEEGDIAGIAEVLFATDSIVAFYDAHVHEYYKDNSYINEEIIQLKTGEGWTRQAYFSFDLTKIKESDKRIVFRTYFSEVNIAGEQVLQLEGNTESYGNDLKWTNKDSKPFTIIGTNEMSASEVKSYICWDVTEFVKEQKEAGATIVTLRMSVISGEGPLSSFLSTESAELKYYPSLLIVRGEDEPTNMNPEVTDVLKVYPSLFNDHLIISSPEDADIMVINAEGRCLYRMPVVKNVDYRIDTGNYLPGVYIIQCQSIQGMKSLKVIKTT